jgi:hypothetical protein
MLLSKYSALSLISPFGVMITPFMIFFFMSAPFDLI